MAEQKRQECCCIFQCCKEHQDNCEIKSRTVFSNQRYECLCASPCCADHDKSAMLDDNVRFKSNGFPTTYVAQKQQRYRDRLKLKSASLSALPTSAPAPSPKQLKLPDHPLQSYEIDDSFSFDLPASVTIIGQSMSGKSTTLIELITRGHFRPPPQRIAVFAPDTSKFQELQAYARVTMESKLPSSLQDLNLIPQEFTMVIIDDQQDETRNSAFITKFYTQFVNHKQLSLVNILQNPYMGTVRNSSQFRNSMYFILTRSPSAMDNVYKVADTCFSAKLKSQFIDLHDFYLTFPFSFLVVNSDPRSDLKRRVFHSPKTWLAPQTNPPSKLVQMRGYFTDLMKLIEQQDPDEEVLQAADLLKTHLSLL